MKILASDFESKFILENEHGKFHPVYTFDNFVFNEEFEQYEYIGLTIIKIAEEVYQEWVKQNEQIDICPPKTLEERLEEAEQRLAESEEEKKLLKAQVEANASSYEFLESCIMEMAEKVYA